MHDAADPRPAPPLGDPALQTQTLESLTTAVNYHRWLTDLARPHLGDHPIEVGSGLGDYAETWLAHGVPEITVTEVDEGRVNSLRERFSGRPEVRVRFIDVLTAEPASHSAFVRGLSLSCSSGDMRIQQCQRTIPRHHLLRNPRLWQPLRPTAAPPLVSRSK